jgi:hypothetical protein
MRFRSLEITYNSRKQAEIAAINYVRTNPDIRVIIARMARSEVKNYLAAIAEDAGMAFGAPGRFLQEIRDELARRQNELYKITTTGDGGEGDLQPPPPLTSHEYWTTRLTGDSE